MERPGLSRSRGGIINTYWEFLMGGDGFEVLPAWGDPSTCYAMSQQGNIRRLNLETGGSVDIKPTKADDVELRFHWNSAIAQDPFEKNTIYFGSQFVHKSTDRGDSWSFISPDLTTNDSSKQKFNESGGLTYDVTGAENHTCILAISPSAVEQGVIWVGTDDGKIQVTTDGGATWTNCSPKIKELPEGAWVPQIVASATDGGEAYVVVNNYRLNDYAPYLFHTLDYGKKWSRVVGPSDVPGYVLSFARDPEEPRLQFLGTEYGLYVSIDGGEKWTKWTSGYPTVPTMDMVIHPREHDLVIGTFGRSAYVIDDISPLRALAREYETIQDSKVFVVEPPVAYLADSKNAPGYYFIGDAYFEGENRSMGARLSYFVHLENDLEKENKDTVTIVVRDQDNKLVRTLKRVPENGLNRAVWRMDRKGARVNFSKTLSRSENGESGGGGYVLPGEYQVELGFRGDTVSTLVRVEPDPRRDYDLAGMKIKQEKTDLLIARLDELNDALGDIRKCFDSYKLVKKLTGDKVSDEFKETSKNTKLELDRISELVFRNESVQGIYYPSDALSVKMRGTYSITGATQPLTPNQLQKHDQFMALADETLEMINTFMDNQWQVYKELVDKSEVNLFKE